MAAELCSIKRVYDVSFKSVDVFCFLDFFDQIRALISSVNMKHLRETRGAFCELEMNRSTFVDVPGRQLTTALAL
jgi:hypothetical protein